MGVWKTRNTGNNPDHPKQHYFVNPIMCTIMALQLQLYYVYQLDFWIAFKCIE